MRGLVSVPSLVHDLPYLSNSGAQSLRRSSADPHELVEDDIYNQIT